MSTIQQNVAGPVTRLQFQTPNNTITRTLTRELRRALKEHCEDPESRVLILRGAGEHIFSPGLDLAEVASLDRSGMRDFMVDFCGLYRDVFAHPKPTIAEINGHALAGGCILASSCDFRLSTDQATIGLTELNRYFSIPAGGQRILQFRLQTSSLTQLIFRPVRLSAQDALTAGWLDWAGRVEDLSGEVSCWADDLALKSSRSFEISKQNLQGALQREVARLDAEQLDDFLDAWFAPQTQQQIQTAIRKLKLDP